MVHRYAVELWTERFSCSSVAQCWSTTRLTNGLGVEGKEDGEQLREGFIQSSTRAELFESASRSESVGHVPEREGSTNGGLST